MYPDDFKDKQLLPFTLICECVDGDGDISLYHSEGITYTLAKNALMREHPELTVKWTLPGHILPLEFEEAKTEELLHEC